LARTQGNAVHLLAQGQLGIELAWGNLFNFPDDRGGCADYMISASIPITLKRPLSSRAGDW
jgi:hypothetical protein